MASGSGSRGLPGPDGRSTFRRPDRIRRKSDFERAYRDGFRISTRTLSLVVRPNGLGCARLGISAGKRLGSAPTRNRVKRRLRELFRADRRLRSLGIDLVVNVRPVGPGAFDDLAEEFRRGSALVCRRIVSGR